MTLNFAKHKTINGIIEKAIRKDEGNALNSSILYVI